MLQGADATGNSPMVGMAIREIMQQGAAATGHFPTVGIIAIINHKEDGRKDGKGQKATGLQQDKQQWRQEE
jgi:hypothetical protein